MAIVVKWHKGAMSADAPSLLMVPGLHGSGSDHWQTIWAASLPAARVEQDDWDTPRYDAWSARLAEAVHAQPAPVVLIAHSLGTTLVTRWLLTGSRAHVAGAFLVAPVDIERVIREMQLDITGFDPLSAGAVDGGGQPRR